MSFHPTVLTENSFSTKRRTSSCRVKVNETRGSETRDHWMAPTPSRQQRLFGPGRRDDTIPPAIVRSYSQ